MQNEQAQSGGNYINCKGKEDRAALEQLVASAMEGEKEALANLCQAIAKGVLFRASYIMRERMDAEDAAQETLIRVCRNIHNLSDPKAFGAWLDRIIINETRRVAAKNSRHDNVISLSEYMDNVQEENEEDNVELMPLEFTVREEYRRIVNEIIDTLPNRQREAVLLHYFDGLNVTETANAMEITKGKSSYYIKLACEKVKSELSKRAVNQEAAYSLGFLPIGPLLEQTLRIDVEGFAHANDVWVNQAVSKCIMAMKSKAVITIAGSSIAHSWSFAGVLVALVASGAVFLGVSVGGMNASNMPEAPDSISAVQGKVILDGSGNGSFVNPSSAIAQAGSGDGDMTALDWQITAVGSDTVMYSGEGGIVSSALADLRLHGDNGEYLLSFDMVDGAGSIYVLDCNFLISTG